MGDDVISEVMRIVGPRLAARRIDSYEFSQWLRDTLYGEEPPRPPRKARSAESSAPPATPSWRRPGYKPGERAAMFAAEWALGKDHVAIGRKFGICPSSVLTALREHGLGPYAPGDGGPYADDAEPVRGKDFVVDSSGVLITKDEYEQGAKGVG